MLDNLQDIIVTGIISGTAFEAVKSAFVHLKNWMIEKSLPFNVGGWWGAYHEHDPYSAFELLILKHCGDTLSFKLYQKTNDGRFHFYRGIGYIRESKISLAYQESNDNRSNLTGTFNLKVHNASEHSLCLSGRYTEFSKDDKECSAYPYELKEINTSFKERALAAIFRKRYIKHLMGEETFKNVCKSKVQ